MGNYVENYDLIVKKWEPVLVTPAEETKRGIYFLSNVDEDENLVRTIYCYHHKKTNDDDPSGVIKNALSKVLVHYHPLAGRLVTTTADEGRLAVDCTGEGVLFVEAEANCSMGSIDFSKPDAETRGKLVYEIPGVKSIFQIPPLMIQVTKFKCGGFVLGVSFNHLIADGQAAMEFINSWAETARGLPLSVQPFLDRTILKARNPPRIEYHHAEYDVLEDKSSPRNNKEETIYDYIYINEQMIQKLKRQVAAEIYGPSPPGPVQFCSSYEALSAFAWRARAKALKMAADQETRILLVVNTRNKFDPPLPRGYFGNAIKFISAISLAGDLVDKPLSYAVGKVQEAIRSVTDSQLRSGIDYYEVHRTKRPMGCTMISTAWSRLAFGSTDFGWGEPVMTGPAELPVDEVIIFLAHPKEKGSLNAYAGLPASAMRNFQKLWQEII
ncbi:unnamed protein product [Linum tenue]|uniref:Uncharacterized protein n=3 Tax=Linum tenue TaxID=586396 RepID=A0AAV0NGU9_9ROSI|nr:unnamed protein product [Linum tenue]